MLVLNVSIRIFLSHSQASYFLHQAVSAPVLSFSIQFNPMLCYDVPCLHLRVSRRVSYLAGLPYWLFELNFTILALFQSVCPGNFEIGLFDFHIFLVSFSKASWWK